MGNLFDILVSNQGLIEVRTSNGDAGTVVELIFT